MSGKTKFCNNFFVEQHGKMGQKVLSIICSFLSMDDYSNFFNKHMLFQLFICFIIFKKTETFSI